MAAPHLVEMQQQLVKLVGDPAPALAVALLALLGFNVIWTRFLALSRFAYIYFVRPGKNLRRLGEWAVVTGATDGIGKAYAEALAKQGLNIILVSRTESKLKDVAADIQSRFKVETKVVPADFSSMDDATWGAVAAAVGSAPVGVLINSAGMSYDHAEYFDLVDDKQIADLIAINVVATTKMCSIVLPGMKARKRGAIVNIGSGSATFLPSYPLYAVYGATKAYVDELTVDLHSECAPCGVSVENQAPFYVATKMSKIRHARLDAPSPKTWVAAGMRQIGYNSTASPYWVHAAMAALVNALPLWLINPYLMSAHKSLRARWYKKQQRGAKKAQ